jgi:hypothetical protein
MVEDKEGGKCTSDHIAFGRNARSSHTKRHTQRENHLSESLPDWMAEFQHLGQDFAVEELNRCL